MKGSPATERTTQANTAELKITSARAGSAPGAVRSIVGHLILADWRLHRLQILVTLIAGAIAMAVFQLGGEKAMVVGSVWYFIALIMIGHMLPITAIVNERKNQNLAFLMSLPVSSIQYTTAKLVSTLGIFLAPWFILVISAMLSIATRSTVPHGVIPVLLILAMLPFVGFSIIAGAALVGESEGWGIAANVFCSSSYGLTWYFMTTIPGLMMDAQKPVPVWSHTVRLILGAEFAAIVLILGVTYYLQSRKRDFI